MALAGFFIFICVIALSSAVPVHAAVPAYAAQELIRSDQRVVLAPGASKTFTIGFKNTGRTTWRSEGRGFVSIYTYDPKYRKSVFSDASWMNGVQPARLTETAVSPGQIGRVSFTLYAPLEAGTYQETFALAAEDLAWIPGGRFTIEIVVGGESAPSFSVGDSSPSRNVAAGYKALQLLVSDKKLNLDVGATKEFRVGFKNIGRTVWQRGGAAPTVIRAEANSNAYSFRDPSWLDVQTAAQPSSNEVKPGEMSFFNFKLSAPRSAGVYLARFTLAAGDDMIEGGQIDIPIEVRQGTVPASSPVDTIYDAELSNSGARGPNIRVGLFSPDDPTKPVTLTANGSYRLMDSDGNAVMNLSGQTSVVFDPPSRTYAVSNGSFRKVLSKYLYFEPLDSSTIFEILSYESRPTWDPSLNFNRFRGKIEIFFVQGTGRLWVVEEVPMEDYMRGLAETSNGSHFEYQKALVTAARTYALFVVSIGGKHKSEFFDLNTTGNDQVYKGYTSELVRPNVVRAAEDTRGMVVTYGGEIVVTPYFSRSDGRTRAWTEVWSSNHHPWLISKPAPYDQGKTLWGHGVGMSASDALGRAEAGTGWQDILKYYYTGVELKKLY